MFFLLYRLEPHTVGLGNPNAVEYLYFAYRRLGPILICRPLPLLWPFAPKTPIFPGIRRAVLLSLPLFHPHFFLRIVPLATLQPIFFVLCEYVRFLPAPRTNYNVLQTDKNESSGNAERNLQRHPCVLAFPGTVFRSGTAPAEEGASVETR